MATDNYPRFIVTCDWEDDEAEYGEQVACIRGRASDSSHTGRAQSPPVYNMPLLWGEVAWCQLAADALNEADARGAL